MKKSKRNNIIFFARSERIAKMGPYNSEVEAWKALRGLDGLPVKDAQVWPEEIPKKAKPF